ncbi:hypothetical protein M446_1498 [Methylobacterium sp. 4-46]|uniref:hypothetical protein n=1 Tax=unclassified Methylobacterium TaxID=2615210 RepID=UPI000152CE33|nr:MULTISPECIES: hypothetical protein [Methylobacterium]ACA16003.1 hypothetical protein M446_1498 [Methylobacterium sp. 4-46]WFT81717.1 hypothetical protein QA634_07595 [Methylobacterium nodulans]
MTDILTPATDLPARALDDERSLGRATLPPLLAAFAAAADDPATPYPVVCAAALDVLRVSAGYAASLSPYEAFSEFDLVTLTFINNACVDKVTHETLWFAPDAFLLPVLIAQRELGLPFNGALNRQLGAVIDLGLLRFLAVEPDIHFEPFENVCGRFETAFHLGDPARAFAAVDRLRILLGVVPYEAAHPRAPDAALWPYFSLRRYLACLPQECGCGGYDEKIAELEPRRGTLRGCGDWDAERELWLEDRLAQLHHERDSWRTTGPNALPAGFEPQRRYSAQDV